MSAVIGLGLLLLLIWIFFIKGLLWKGPLIIFGFIGMRLFLISQFPNSTNTAITIYNNDISWATAIPLVIISLAMMRTKVYYNE